MDWEVTRIWVLDFNSIVTKITDRGGMGLCIGFLISSWLAPILNGVRHLLYTKDKTSWGVVMACMNNSMGFEEGMS